MVEWKDVDTVAAYMQRDVEYKAFLHKHLRRLPPRRRRSRERPFARQVELPDDPVPFCAELIEVGEGWSRRKDTAGPAADQPGAQEIALCVNLRAHRIPEDSPMNRITFARLRSSRSPPPRRTRGSPRRPRSPEAQVRFEAQMPMRSMMGEPATRKKLQREIDEYKNCMRKGTPTSAPPPPRRTRRPAITISEYNKTIKALQDAQAHPETKRETHQ